MRRADLPGHRHADLRGQGAGRRQPDLDAAADPRGGRGSDEARQAAAELGRFDHRRELRQQPRPGHADHPFRSVGEPGDRDQADPQGRRLREHQRAVLAAGRARSPRAAPTARSRACASASCTRSGRRRARAAARAPSACASAAIAPRATRTRRSSSSARSTTRNPDARLAALEDSIMDGGQHADRRADGVRRPDVAHRLQDRRAEPSAGELLRLGRLRLLGVPPARRAARRDERRDHSRGCTATRRCRRSRCCRRKPSRPASRGRAARLRCSAPISDEQVRALKVGDVVLDLRPHVHRPRRRARAPDEARAAGRSVGRRPLPLRPGGGEGRRLAGASPPRARRRASAKSLTRPRSSSATACGS